MITIIHSREGRHASIESPVVCGAVSGVGNVRLRTIGAVETKQAKRLLSDTSWVNMIIGYRQRMSYCSRDPLGQDAITAIHGGNGC